MTIKNSSYEQFLKGYYGSDFLERRPYLDEMNKCFERAINKSPELYGWEYKKFRKLRGSIKNIY